MTRHITILCLLLPASAAAQARPDSATRTRADSARADSARALPTMQVTASAVATDARRVAQPTAILDGTALRRTQGASLGETMELIPGVRSLSMTTGIGKPVIRGLTNNRVVTLANGQRTETQQWGHDHSPNVESADAERLEVVKGPASVLYGSDALGGVVNVVRRKLPSAEGAQNVTRGRMALAYNSANLAPTATLTGEGARGAFGWRVSGTGRRAEDLRTPTGPLFNSGNRTGYLEAAGGYHGKSRDVELTVSSRDETIRIADDPVSSPDYTGRQRIRTERFTVESNARRGAHRLHMQAGYESNRRSEFEDATTRDVTLGLHSRTAIAFANWHHAPWRGVTGVVGTQLQHTDFRTFGEETLIPDNTAQAVGVYALQQKTVGDWSLSGGARYDWRTLDTPGNDVLQLAATSRRFDALTGTAGVVYKATAPVSVALNVARGFRAPSASDLFANGFHEGTRAFEIGRADLRVETSLNTDLGVRLRTSRVFGEVTGYVNRIRDYIYLAPVGLPGRALDSLEVRQGNARLVGAEAALTALLAGGFSANVTGDMVHATNTTDRTALPFVPPLRTTGTLRWDEAGGHGRSFAVTGEWNARQTRVFRDDFAPSAWGALHLSTGFSRLTSRGLVHVDLSVRNATNARYRDFMSRYKEFANAAGRALVLRVTTDL
ncbi:MAG: TonB-dependent receptor [Gemmatimonas sp.]|jgi:iron complex outermembrane receptor protein|uniref:TonB-dependent receptor n=1 Tax=Gemmatimonas sp. TaxID=1962908 RepID=UPI0022C04F73|nr:TonB-dependent receptor [Gemmatimonas sp.]MCZ8012717.1 TonB-dependent receptor [Gemmatimonas sp.]MCZ8268128.1 TonB-dependent receptor [Gemmatimonas sp.]